MSDPKNISPLLDGFTLGAPISEHHGVACYPAIRENSNKKYIIKVISVPASQAQFDAMLLSGAYKDPGDAMEYFRGNGEEILKEAEILKELSRIEGFLPYDGWQMEPISRRRLGYEIYLVGSYKRSLDKYIRKNAFTHLEAINLSLDLCSALSLCRQSGYLYADLKPNNIYVSEKKEYRIGDLGFLKLDALRYVSYPERYISPYSPPELQDPMEPVNLSVDTYAVGMILYQLYNDGHLPFTGTVPEEELPSPCHADYELAEIIMKAIHPDHKQRWTDPKDLGKAIATYMQKNSVNDIPITPFIPLDVNPEDIVVIAPRKKHSEKKHETATEEPVSHDEVSDGNDLPLAIEEPEQQEAAAAEAETPEEPAVLQEEEISEEAAPEIIEEAEESQDITEEIPEETNEIPEASEDVSAETVEASAEVVETAEQSAPLTDISADVESNSPNLPENISEEVASILFKADDLIAHDIPVDTAFPTVDMPEDLFAFATEEPEAAEDSFPEDPLMEEPAENPVPVKKKKTKRFADPSRKRARRKFLSGCFTFLLVCGLGVGGYWYYQNVYLETIDSISLSGTQDQITVLVDTAVEESTLIVHCTDENGNRHSESVRGGKATFTQLKPSTQYTIEVDVTGFHKLEGKTSDVFTTEAPTQILTFHAIAGSEDGSVKLDFTVNGEEPNFWNIRYSAEGEEERLETVTGHTAMISGLSVGKVYTFTLEGDKNFDLSGETTLQYLASRLILAENLTVSSTDGSDITVSWNTPGDAVVESWNVRLYDGYGFEEHATVTENSVQFTDIDSASHYTVEVTAAGMTQPSRIRISEDPLLISEFRIDESAKTEMEITWDYTGEDPEGGWLLIYTVEGSGNQVIPCKKAEATVSPLIPGANYKFTLESADNRTIFNNTKSHHTVDAEAFAEHAYIPENVSIDLLKTPEDKNWRFETISQDVFTNTFRVGESASMVFESSSSIYIPGNKTSVLFVFRDAYGNALPEISTEISVVWRSIWTKGNAKTGELNIPRLPSVPGNYVMELYFNGCSVEKFDIVITE